MRLCCIFVLVTAVLSTTLLPPAVRAAEKAKNLDYASAPYTLEKGARIKNLAVRDLNGDGLADIVILCRDRILLYFQSGGGEFPGTASQTLTPAANVVMIDFANLDKDKDIEILYATTLGVVYLKYKDGQYDRKMNLLLKTKSIFLPPTRDGLVWIGFAGDTNGDSNVDLMLPTETGLGFWEADGGGQFQHAGDIQIDALTELHAKDYPGPLHGFTHLKKQYPPFRWVDYTGDGVNDFVYIAPGMLHIFPCLDGKYSQAGKIELTFPFEEEKEKLIEDQPPRIMDLNADGIPDLMFTMGNDGKIKFYLGSKDMTGYSEMAQLIHEKGWIYTAWAQDINADGRPDLCMQMGGEVDWKAAMKVFLTKSTTLFVKVYLNRSADGKSLFSKSYDYIEDFTEPVNFQPTFEGVETVGRQAFIDYYNDFNGDGKFDLFAATDRTQVSFYYYDDDKNVYPKKPSESYTTRDSTAYTKVSASSGELNGDGYKDFILYYQGGADQPDVFDVYLSERQE